MNVQTSLDSVSTDDPIVYWQTRRYTYDLRNWTGIYWYLI